METSKQQFPWLELMDCPAFCVKDGIVIAANSAAENRMLKVGADVWEIVADHRCAYEQFQSGQLHLTVLLGVQSCSAIVTRTQEFDIFLIPQDAEDEQLQALALAAQQLRIPLSNVMAVLDQLLSGMEKTDAQSQLQASQINHGLFQLLRIVSNMSDAGNCKNIPSSNKKTVNFTALLDEIMEKAHILATRAGIHIDYTGMATPVFGMADEEKLERAIYNLLSNAIKFSPANSTVSVGLSKNGDQLSLSVCNQSAEDAINQTFWNRYLRAPAIEDNRFGLGLGMTLISATAAAHNGTVLVDHPTQDSTRVTMTITITKDNSGTVRTPVLRIGDYAGGRDKGLLEFSEFLPTDAYRDIN